MTAPAALPPFDLRGSGNAHAVFRGATRVSRYYNCRDAATARWNQLEAIAKITPRACLTCKSSFNSTGKGHRLCAPCRKAT
jgi:hypothetical protein